MPLVFNNKPKITKCFNRKTGLEHDFISEPCMNKSIFVEWFKKFDSYIGETRSRKFLLVINEESFHGTEDNLADLLIIEVIFRLRELRRSFSL